MRAGAIGAAAAAPSALPAHPSTARPPQTGRDVSCAASTDATQWARRLPWRQAETAGRGTTSGRPRSRRQVGKQSHFERLIRVETLVIDARGPKLPSITVDHPAHLPQV